MKVAIFVFDGLQILDFSGPMDVFATRPDLFEVYTVGETSDAVTTDGGLSINPRYSLQQAPQPDLLVIPGGNMSVPMASDAVEAWVRKVAAGAEHVLSVCTGSFLIAKAGLLDGGVATSYHSRLESLAEMAGSKFKVVGDQRFVDNGKVVSSAGISSGIDAAFHLVSKIHGLGVAQKIALDLEFDWQHDRHYARAALADLRIPKLDWPQHNDWTPTLTEGDTRQWRLEGVMTNNMEPEAFRNHITDELKRVVGQSRVTSKGNQIQWTQDENGDLWGGSMTLTHDGEKSYRLVLDFKDISESAVK